MQQVAKTKVQDVLKQNQADKLAAAGKGVDKRNLYLKKEGLLNEGEWIHKEPALTSKELEQRQRLYIQKDKALKASPNLSVSQTRIQLRNLPRKDFLEPELKELMQTVVTACFAAQNKPANNRKALSKIIKQVKILRDGEKTTLDDVGNVEKIGSGIAFAEFSDPEYALYAVQYLNNMNLTTRGLIVDFSLNDAQKLRMRDMRIEKQREK